jgi:hypothetical protein
MKMMKRKLITIALVALLATSAHAALSEHYFPIGDHHAVKVDGSEKVRRPYEYEVPTVCNIPVKMHIGMFIQIKDCEKKKVVLQQVDCGDIGKGSGDFPCYFGCVSFEVRANFEVKMGTSLEKVGGTIKDWSAYYDGGDVVPGDGEYHTVKACVQAWKTRIYEAAPGDEIDVGKLHITVKPNV